MNSKEQSEQVHEVVLSVLTAHFRSSSPEEYRDEAKAPAHLAHQIQQYEYQAARDAFRALVGSGPFEATLQTAACAVAEARLAFMLAGRGEPALDQQLRDVEHRLILESKVP